MMDSLESSLLQELECPVCYDYMSPPITLCVNGHNICKYCKPKPYLCPTCRGDILETNNRTAETLSRNITHACRYRNLGCTGHFLVDFKEEHEKTCWFRPYNCPFSINSKCTWAGPFRNMYQHIKNNPGHVGHFYEGGRQVNIAPFRFYRAKLRRWPQWLGVFYTLDELFLFLCKEIESYFYVTVFFIGDSNSKTFLFHAAMRDMETNETVSNLLRCPNYKLFLEKGFMKETCATFPVIFVAKRRNIDHVIEMSIQVFEGQTEPFKVGLKLKGAVLL